VYDIFGDAAPPPKQKQEGRNADMGGLNGAAAAAAAAAGLEEGHDDDNDDGEGYYKTRAGEMLQGRYLVRGALGKGVFSTVLSCVDMQQQQQQQQQQQAAGVDSQQALVAIKLIRNNDVMRKAAQKEMKILTEISRTDPDDRRHCVRLLATFDHRQHVRMWVALFIYLFIPLFVYLLAEARSSTVRSRGRINEDEKPCHRHHSL
jgi:serine/threonine protein kinase